MSQTKDLLDNPDPQAKINAYIDALVSQYPNANIIDVTVPHNTNAEALAERGSNFAIEPGAYEKRFTDRIKFHGKLPYIRSTNCFFEGIYSFDKVNFRNGHRYSVFGTPITDDFASGVQRTHGYGKVSAADNLSTNYLTAHQGGNTWSIVSGELTGPAANGWVRTCLFNATAYMAGVTMVALVKKVGNQQVVVRATTDSNFPGYGLQMRDTDVLRIERPGLANLGEASKTWVSGGYYWMKLQAIGTAIKGKAWAAASGTESFEDGVASEPGTWDIEITDATYSQGYCGFSGESSTGKFAYMRITPEIDTATFLYKECAFLRTNIANYCDGALIDPFPEASSHQELTTSGTYNQFFIDMKYCIERVGSEEGVALEAGHSAHLWTSAIQGTYNSIFTDAGYSTVDHYSVALGRGKRFGSFSHGSAGAANTYTVPTSITESATTRHDFIPEKVAYNQSIDVYIVAKGTGDWTMTIHKADNTPVQMCDPSNLADLANSYQVTVANASLTNGELNRFNIDWVSLDPDVTYHYHLTSTVADGTVKTTTSNDLNTAYTIGYKGYASADAIEIDLRNLYRVTGIPVFLGEIGDFWSQDASRTTPILSQAEHEAYLRSVIAALQQLIDDGILVGFCYWRYLGGLEGLASDTDAGAGFNYQLNYAGVVWQEFFDANPLGEQGPSWSLAAV